MSDNKSDKSSKKEKSFSNISTRSFVTVVIILSAIILISGALSYIIPGGSFLRDENGAIITGTYEVGEVSGIAPWRVLTAPLRVFFSEDALTVIMISIFLLIMSGVFNLLEKTGGIRVFIGKLMHKLHDRGGPVVCLTVLIFMLFGSFFGMFEELVTLLPIIVMFMLSMGLDTMTGLGACLMAACFGFSAAITNPFSVGLAAEVSGVSITDGVWLRAVFFVMVYSVLCIFLLLHLKKIRKNPKLSPSFESDEEKRKTIEDLSSIHKDGDDKIFRLYSVFFGIQGVVLVLIASVRAISDYAIPILSASFLITGTVIALILTEKKRKVFGYLLDGAVSMLPAVVMIALASSVKLVMTESGIIDTIMNFVINILSGKSKFLAVILIYFLILFLQIFIGSASAKIILVMPIVMPIATALGLSPTVVILAYCMSDGFTDVILPTNPVLLVALSISGVSYGKWVKWTWRLQLTLFTLSALVLLFGVSIGY